MFTYQSNGQQKEMSVTSSPAAATETQAQAEAPHPLDNAVWRALTGPHAHLAETVGQAVRYRADVSPFVGVPNEPDDKVWADLSALLGPGAELALMAGKPPLPADWPVVEEVHLVQMVDVSLVAGPDQEARLLSPADVPDMLDLVSRTRPGPFRPRTIEMGSYLGIRREGKLIAMAGERLTLPGWTEISAVCTDPAYRGQGLASRLIRAVAVGIRAKGNTPFLHTAAGNTNAIRLYESMGFQIRRKWTMTLVLIPGAPADSPLPETHEPLHGS